VPAVGRIIRGGRGEALAFLAGKARDSHDAPGGCLVAVSVSQRGLEDEAVELPNHFHLQLTLDGRRTIERAVGLVKGNFSYRAKKELGCGFEIWQPGFSDERVWDRESFLRHRAYIDNNPVKAGLADKPENYPYGSAYFRARKKANRTYRPVSISLYGTNKFVP
jgi:hypothetical protein